MDNRLLLFAAVAGTISGVNLFMHKVAANRLTRTGLAGVLTPSYILSLARNPYVYVVVALGFLVLAVDLAFLSNDVAAIQGLNFIIVLGNVIFAVLCVLLLGESADARIVVGVGLGIVALVLLGRF